MMNENFFGKYSVFCVFGSVVGCVVVPLIAQVLQHQSMECMILSAIFLTLTAAHLKKGGSDSHHSKLLIARDYDRKKFTGHSTNSNKKQKSVNSQSNNHKQQQQQQQQQQHHDYQHHEEDYMQQYEHVKILEMERRSEEKRLKKQKKREERLKKKEEETRKLKEEEERRATREKRKKKKDSLLPESHHRNVNNPYHQAITNTYEKYCCGETTRFSSSNTRKHRTYSQDGQQFLHTKQHQQQGYVTKRQNIPRFNNARKNNGTLSTSFDGNYVRSNSESLSINCSSSLSASCSSLSSIGSSGSCSPPPPPCSGGSVWKTPGHYSDSDSTKSLSPHKYDSNSAVSRQQELRKSWTLNSKIVEEPTAIPQSQRVIKSYTNVRPVRSKFPAYNFNSSSLFCSSPEESCSKDLKREAVNKGGEYSLFGTHQFGNAFIKSPII